MFVGWVGWVESLFFGKREDNMTQDTVIGYGRPRRWGHGRRHEASHPPRPAILPYERRGLPVRHG